MSSAHMHGTDSPRDAAQGVIPIPFPPTTRHLLNWDTVVGVIPIPSNSMPLHAALMSPSLRTMLAQPRMLHKELSPSYPIPSRPTVLIPQQNTCMPWDITPGIICIASHHTTQRSLASRCCTRS